VLVEAATVGLAAVARKQEKLQLLEQETIV